MHQSAQAAVKAGRVPVRRRRSQEERSEITRGKLIQAAITTINEVGFSKTTSLAICKRAQVSRGAFQHHFGTVQNLMLDVVTHLSHELVGQIESETIQLKAPTQRLEAIARRYWAVYQGAEYRAVLLIWIGAVHDRDLIGRIDELMRRIDQERSRKWTEIFSSLNISEYDLHRFRRMVLAMVRGLAMHAIYSREGTHFDEILELIIALWSQLIIKNQADGNSAAPQR